MVNGTIWLTGLSGAGKTTVANSVVPLLRQHDQHVFHIDGDEVRKGINSDLGFDVADRSENVRRLAEVAILLGLSGSIVVVSSISPNKSDRAGVRARHEHCGVSFFEIYLNASLEICEARDPKGLYARARRNEIKLFTGIHQRYEPPEKPELIVHASDTPTEAAERIIRLFRRRARAYGRFTAS